MADFQQIAQVRAELNEARAEIDRLRAKLTPRKFVRPTFYAEPPEDSADAKLAVSQRWSAAWKKLAQFRGWPASKHEQNRREVALLRAEIERLRAEPQTLGQKIPDYWSEAKSRWPWLPPTTERLDDEWRNRTRAENALWLVEQASAEAERARERNTRQAAIIEQCPSCVLRLLDQDKEWPLEKLRAALRRYGRHYGQVDGGATCEYLSDEFRRAGSRPCSCGLDAALAAAPEEPKP